MLVACLFVFLFVLLIAGVIYGVFLEFDLKSKRKELENLQAWFKQNDANHISERNERDRLLSQAQKALDENAKELKSLRFANDELSKSVNEFAQVNGQLNAEIVSLQRALNTANNTAAKLIEEKNARSEKPIGLVAPQTKKRAKR